MALNITCYIADDESHAIKTLERYAEKTADLELAGTATDAAVALEAIMRLRPAVAFLDIGMPGIDGLQLAGLLGGPTKIVFVTGRREFGPEAFALSALDYLLKPVSYERFLQCVARLRTPAEQPGTASSFFFVKTGAKGRLEKICIPEIIYISAALNYVEIHFKERTVLTYLSFSDLLEKLPADQFLRIHKSYIVNLESVSVLEYGQLVLYSGITLPIGRVFRDTLQKTLSASFLFSKRESP
ncbi:LytTR family DNA-binding domain-containing protein [Mucilaginibacter sp. L3T2-6]|uniref:LytR/AlgR family response regulator transcription factor n=1 Tax=Mucilaginibacter sp. L3T2-6 TaxID=3062491 RepID=UPI002676C7DB|nr:LytTR family DNA-binding domain-containing protein [Mucilaginibacter sp. L3T2-6]MDO3641251.1 LytTR family DNA-binding domain-containing protein [Mucilaginibacter sp. L3T2-6]MDV6213989.1 LytTR family DNA-binding domain-containing protein [Mucilaginibacter sp. L3T2-6]